MAEMGMAKDRPVQNPSIADYGKESLGYMRETKDILASIYSNITSNRTDDEAIAEVTCLRENAIEIRDVAMQIREMARVISRELFND